MKNSHGVIPTRPMIRRSLFLADNQSDKRGCKLLRGFGEYRRWRA